MRKKKETRVFDLGRVSRPQASPDGLKEQETRRCLVPLPQEAETRRRRNEVRVVDLGRASSPQACPDRGHGCVTPLGHIPTHQESKMKACPDGRNEQESPRCPVPPPQESKMRRRKGARGFDLGMACRPRACPDRGHEQVTPWCHRTRQDWLC